MYHLGIATSQTLMHRNGWHRLIYSLWIERVAANPFYHRSSCWFIWCVIRSLDNQRLTLNLRMNLNARAYKNRTESFHLQLGGKYSLEVTELVCLKWAKRPWNQCTNRVQNFSTLPHLRVIVKTYCDICASISSYIIWHGCHDVRLFLIVNLLSLGYGVVCGWSSPNIILLTSDETPLPSGKITMEEASWIASFICVGGVTGNIFFGFITNMFGRKWPLIIIAIPTCVRNQRFECLIWNPFVNTVFFR